MFNGGRTIDALSFRLHSDARLISNNTVHTLSDHSVCFVPAGLDYAREATVDTLIVIHFHTSDYATQAIESFMPKNTERFSALFHQILEEWKQKKLGYYYRATALLYEIFSECHAQYKKSTLQDSKIQNSVKYILENYKSSKLTISDIAKQSFMSEVYFRKLFKKEYGISPQKYIINLRIQNAVGLILTGYYSLQDVARMSGYNDYKYFSVEFKKITGASPSNYLYSPHRPL